MKKYTKQEVLEQKICFKPMTEEQHAKLCKHFGIFTDYIKNHYYRFYGRILDSTYGTMNHSYTSSIAYKASKEISFEEFDFENTIYTIKDLSEGKCVVANDNGLKDLKRVLRAAFPKHNLTLNGTHSYYFSKCDFENWECSNKTELPIQSVKEFIKQLNMENTNKK